MPAAGANKGTPKRRRAKKPPLVRGEPVVRGILAATLEELAHAGYRAFRIEDVAARAGVNKTTVYRRWPTKRALVSAAILSIAAERIPIPRAGSFREDLLAIGRAIVALRSSKEARGLFQVFITEGLDSELAAIARAARAAHEPTLRAVVEEAAARGELAPGADPMLPLELIGAFVTQKLLDDAGAVDDAALVRVVDLLLLGALRRAPPAPAPATAGRAGARASVATRRRAR